VQALLALAVFIPMTANHFDLSAGFNLGISQVLAIGLQGQGLPWWAAVIAVLLMGALVGLVNGVRNDLRGAGGARGLSVRLCVRALADRGRDRIAGQSHRGSIGPRI
jgi:hypothetical protein